MTTRWIRVVQALLAVVVLLVVAYVISPPGDAGYICAVCGAQRSAREWWGVALHQEVRESALSRTCRDAGLFAGHAHRWLGTSWTASGIGGTVRAQGRALRLHSMTGNEAALFIAWVARHRGPAEAERWVSVLLRNDSRAYSRPEIVWRLAWETPLPEDQAEAERWWRAHQDELKALEMPTL